MKPRNLLLLSLLLPTLLFAQDLNGTWTGGLQQDDKSFVYTLEMTLVQRGDRLSGTMRCGVPETGEYVVEKFRGRMDGTHVSIQEYEVTDSYIRPEALFSWCVKLLEGRLIMEDRENSMTLKGNWRSEQVWSPDTRALSPGICAPGKFVLRKDREETPLLQIAIRERIVLENVLFETSRSRILPESYEELDALYRYLSDNPATRIRLEGHTDRIGKSSQNLILSRKRAAAIKAYLIEKGIDESRIDTRGYGDERPICDPPCKQNRRVEFIITD